MLVLLHNKKTRPMKKLLTLALIFASFTTFAQTEDGSQIAKFDMSGQEIYNLPDTVKVGQTVTFGTYIRNIGASYSGDLEYNISVADQYGTYLVTETKSMLVSMASNDSIYIDHTETFDLGAIYRMGGNIVVIWAKANQSYRITNTTVSAEFVLVDTISKTSTKLADINTSKNEFNICPNPFCNQIKILNAGKDFDRVVLYNTIGKIVKDVTIDHTSVSVDITTNDLPKGTYFVELTGTKEEKQVYRIIKSE